MPKRSPIRLEDVATWDCLTEAAYRAAKGKRFAADVQQFCNQLNSNLTKLQRGILDGKLSLGEASEFQIFDPKPRIIHAPAFRERVLHHALILHVGPVLERSLIFDTYACRIGKGSHAAVNRTQHFARRFEWYGKLDVRQYFASIEHDRLVSMLKGKFKDPPLLALLERIIRSYHTLPGRGLPIGALTSQNFANFYLGCLDRYLLEKQGALGIVRYMDDVIWWCDSKSKTMTIAEAAERFLVEDLKLSVRPPIHINRCSQGIPMCGCRVFPGTIRLSRRRRKRYVEGRQDWEHRFAQGLTDGLGLQAGFAAALATTLHCDASGWRKEELKRRPPLEL